jgi:hypothetical protein
MRGTTFSKETSSYSEWILNENLEKLLGLKFKKFDTIASWNLQIWMKLGQGTYICTY